MKKVRTVIWDLDGVVWQYNDMEVPVQCNALQIRQTNRFQTEYYGMWNDLFAHFDGKIVTYDKVRKYIKIKMPILDLHNISVDLFLEILVKEKSKFVNPNQEAIQMMQYFSEKGLQNIAITDWFEEHQKIALEEFHALSYMKKIYGCDNSYFKNSVGKKEEITKKLHMEGQEETFLMIGDSLSSDISFAERLGIKSIWYNQNNKENTTSHVPTMEVHSLLELKNVI